MIRAQENEMSDAASLEDQRASLGDGPVPEFLVQMENRLPADFAPDERAELLRAEAIRAAAVAANDADSRIERLMQDDLGRRPSTLLRTDSGRQVDRGRAGPSWQLMQPNPPAQAGPTGKLACSASGSLR